MTRRDDALAAEDRFFAALLRGDGEALRALLTPDFVLIDVMTGSEIPGSVLADLVGAASGWRLASAQGTPIAAGPAA